MDKEKLIRKYDSHVSMYKRIRNNRRLSRWRSDIIKNAHGRVLEVGVGIGLNFPYYDKENVSLTGIDFSPEMIKNAGQMASECELDADLRQEDVEELQFEPDSFDCIVSTLTMCGYQDPNRLLNNFNQWCRKGGTILLMEHGISSNPVLSVTQKAVDPLFKKTAGCHCDRNILKLVGESSLQIDHTKRYWTDIVSLVWASPAK